MEEKLEIEIESETGLEASEAEATKKETKEEEANVAEELASEETEPKQGHLINLAEQLVLERVSEVMTKMGVCTCSICTNDVLALTLNSLQQKYVTTDAGKQYMQLDIFKKQYETDVLTALTKACVRVKASPRH